MEHADYWQKECVNPAPGFQPDPDIIEDFVHGTSPILRTPGAEPERAAVLAA